MIYFRLSADADEFLTMAKFRALRKLWAWVEEACGLKPVPALVAAETAWRMMTQARPLREHAARNHRGRSRRAWAAPTRSRCCRSRGARAARSLRAPDRAQHPVDPAGGVQSRSGSRTPAAGSGGIEELTRSSAARRGHSSKRSSGPAVRRQRSSRASMQEKIADVRDERVRQWRGARTRSPAPAIFPISPRCRFRCSMSRQRRRRPSPPC